MLSLSLFSYLLHNSFSFRFWYENPSVFTPGQVSQLRASSLTRVVCDNGDDIDRVARDVFVRPEKEEDLVQCQTVPRMSLNEWFGEIF